MKPCQLLTTCCPRDIVGTINHSVETDDFPKTILSSSDSRYSHWGLTPTSPVGQSPVMTRDSHLPEVARPHTSIMELCCNDWNRLLLSKLWHIETLIENSKDHGSDQKNNLILMKEGEHEYLKVACKRVAKEQWIWVTLIKRKKYQGQRGKMKRSS